jgi:hypothetical protein
VEESQGSELTVAAILLADRSQGEAVEPAVSTAERRRYGELAPVVQLLRLASTSTRNAHLLACRTRRGHRIASDAGIDRVQVEALDQAVEETWRAKVESERAFRDVAAMRPQLFMG